METLPTGGARPLILTADQDLLDQLLRLCAAAGVTADVLAEAARARQHWPRASAVMVGDDAAAAVSRLSFPRRDHVLLVSQARDPTPLWQLAVQVRADEVAVLPGAQSTLIARLSDLADGTAIATTVGVIGACGGAGCSTFAVALALTAAKAGLPSILVDADPLGGGVELVVGCEDREGLRWPEVASTRGRVSAVAFRSALPTVGRLAVLSWDRAQAGQTDSATMSSMVRAAQRGSRVVVMDLPRRLDEAACGALLLSDALMLVTPSEVRAIASARVMLGLLRELAGDIRVVVRTLAGSDLAASAVADALGLPLAGIVPTQRTVAKAVNEGLGPLARGSLERACRLILNGVVDAGAGSR